VHIRHWSSYFMHVIISRLMPLDYLFLCKRSQTVHNGNTGAIDECVSSDCDCGSVDQVSKLGQFNYGKLCIGE
jgi:hypothetical protein